MQRVDLFPTHEYQDRYYREDSLSEGAGRELCGVDAYS